jgi:putative phosphoribosyl transferase
VLERRERAYRGERPPPELRGRTVLLVDDGIATGSTMRAAIAAVRLQQPARVVVAVPAAAPTTCQALAREVDQVVCAITPEPFYAVGLWYEDFSETTDAEIRDLLRRGAAPGERGDDPPRMMDPPDQPAGDGTVFWGA